MHTNQSVIAILCHQMKQHNVLGHCMHELVCSKMDYSANPGLTVANPGLTRCFGLGTSALLFNISKLWGKNWY